MYLQPTKWKSQNISISFISETFRLPHLARKKSKFTQNKCKTFYFPGNYSTLLHICSAFQYAPCSSGRLNRTHTARAQIKMLLCRNISNLILLAVKFNNIQTGRNCRHERKVDLPSVRFPGAESQSWIQEPERTDIWRNWSGPRVSSTYISTSLGGVALRCIGRQRAVGFSPRMLHTVHLHSPPSSCHGCIVGILHCYWVGLGVSKVCSELAALLLSAQEKFSSKSVNSFPLLFSAPIE